VKTYVEQKLKIGPTLGHEIIILAPGDSYQVIEKGPNARLITLPSPRFPLDRKYWYFGDEAALHAELDRLNPDLVEVSSPWRSPRWWRAGRAMRRARW
jgi:alpha-1,6-mannosyltransferase